MDLNRVGERFRLLNVVFFFKHIIFYRQHSIRAANERYNKYLYGV